MSVMSKSMMQSAAAQRRCVVTRMVPFRGERTTICSDLGSKFSTSSRQILCSSDEDCGLGHVRERGVTGPFTSCDSGFAHTTFHWPNLFLHQQPATEIFLSFDTEPRKIFFERFLPSSHCFFFNAIFTLPSQSTFDSTTNWLPLLVTVPIRLVPLPGSTTTLFTHEARRRRWPQQISVFFFLG